MKIAILRDGPLIPPTTGGAYVINNFLKFLTLKGGDVFLIRCYRGWENWKYYTDVPYSTLLLKPSDFYTRKYKISKFINENSIDIVQLDSTESVISHGRLIKAQTNAKIIYEAHNVDSVLFERLEENKNIVGEATKKELEMSKISDRILVRSKFDEDCFRAVGVPASKMAVCPTGVDPKSIKYNSKRSSKRSILFLGNLDYAPNEEAVSIISKVIAPQLESSNPELEFKVVGKGGKRLKRKYNNKNINFTGSLDSLDVVLSEAAIALCPIISGSGTRLKILDYLAAGIPVISSNLGIEGLESEIKDCVIIEDDFSRYASIIRKLITDDSREISKKGLEFINLYRSWDKMIDNFIRNYQIALREK